jgi:hypothetical protein
VAAHNRPIQPKLANQIRHIRRHIHVVAKLHPRGTAMTAHIGHDHIIA